MEDLSGKPDNSITEEYQRGRNERLLVPGECSSAKKYSIGKGELMRPRLRLFIGEDEHSGTEVVEREATLELRELTAILADAIIWDRSWVSDLADERVKVSADLYEVLMVYKQLRPSA
ncbi:MAG: hypothetical protein P8J37_15010 [Fuerstiella sp.]|nr:hypothetical protein [Fuerstiella sp.]